MFKQYFSSPAQPTYDVRTPTRSAGPRAYHPQRYVPQQYATRGGESSRGGHERRITVDTADLNYTSPLPAYMTQPAYDYPVPVQVRDTRPKTSYASETDRLRAKAQRHSDFRPSKTTGKKQKISVKVADLDQNIFDDYSPRGTPPPPYNDYTEDAQRRYAEYETHHVAPPSYSTPRPRASTSNQKPSRQSSTKKPRKATKPQIPVATIADVRSWNLSPQCEQYSLKNWDPREEPVTLLGSVFDADSLGKWIYDWTVFHHGAGAPMSDEAGQLWLALIQLAAKRKQAEACLPRIRSRRKKQLVTLHLQDSDGTWQRLVDLLQACEKYMYSQARKVSTSTGTRTQYGSNSGCEFVDSIFGRDRELETTINLVNEIDCWTRRFEDECEEILRRPRD